MGRIEAEVVSGRLASMMAEISQSIDRDTHDAVSRIADDSELIYTAHALRRTGRMARGIKARVSGTHGVVTVNARDPQSGFDYVAVTRFGHRKRRIYPIRARALRIPVGQIGFGARARGFIFRASVRGFRPRGDWALRAWPQVERNARRESARLGRDISARFG